MADVPLPLDRFSADAHLTALEDLVNRYVREGEPVHYKKAAINLNETTTSSCLRFFSDINLIEAEKAGVYVPSSPVVDYFRKVGEAKEMAIAEIEETLEEYNLYNEVIFLAETSEFEVEELTKKVVGQLGIDKDNQESVSTAIEIFSQFGFLSIGEKQGESIVQISSKNQEQHADLADPNNDSDTQEPGSSTEEYEKSSVRSFDKNTIDEIDFPPTRSDPETLLELLDVLSKGGTHATSELSDSLEVSKRHIQYSTQYGKALGFVEETEDGYELTESGYELSFVSEESEKTELLRNGIKNYPSYKHIIQASLSEMGENANSIDSPTIKKELRTTFGFRDNSDSTLRNAINTLLKSLESAGFGQYVRGSGNNPTRLETSPEELKSIRGLVFDEKGQQARAPQPAMELAEDEKSNNLSDGDKGQTGSKEVTTSPLDRTGPTVRISEVRLQNFRNIQDTGFVELENVTTLIGKNESGKTSTLEGIYSFDQEYEYTERDLSNTAKEVDEGGPIPIVSLRFELSEQLIDEFYPEISDEIDPPLTITRTKYFDNSYESDIDPSIDEDIELPTPNLLYYDSYNLISDTASLDQLNNGDRDTFKNLLSIGGLSSEDFNSSQLAQFNTVERAENRIEDKLNEAWSQKSLNIRLNWVDSEDTIHLLIQDQLNPDSAVDERPLTYPSQRSEGFQWFLSFYINLLSESDSSGLESKVLLLDDPAVFLHPEGKRDWLESVNEIGENEQVIFSSHSPYLIDKRYPSRIRAVEDTPRAGTKIREDIFGSDSHTLEPLRNALGVDLGSSPFVSRRQLLVEGPTEYYVIAAVANYFSQVLEREIFSWEEVSVMPVRGDVVGMASWLESEGIDYAILLDSDQAGQDVYDRIEQHNVDIDEDRAVLLQSSIKSENVVTEDMFDPHVYVSEFNSEYKEFTSELDNDFPPASVEEEDGLEWVIGGIEYDGTRLDQVLVEYLESTNLSEELQNSRGEIELRKRQIAERVASRINGEEVSEDQLESFNRLFADIESSM